MKSLLKTLLFLCIATLSNAQMVACGSGLFPVVVQVLDIKTLQPVSNISVHLLDADNYRKKERDPALLENAIMKRLGVPVLTDPQGVALIFQPDGFSVVSYKDEIVYSRTLSGVIVLQHNNNEIQRIDLEVWAKQTDFKPSQFSVPWIIVYFDSITK